MIIYSDTELRNYIGGIDICNLSENMFGTVETLSDTGHYQKSTLICAFG